MFNIDYRKLKPCKWCGNKMQKPPVYDTHQGRVSILCPHCLYRRSQWTETWEEAVEDWNRDN